MKKPESMSQEELVAEVKNLRSRKKYGLVWEDKPEDVADRCLTELPVLIEDESKIIDKVTTGRTNLIIEGDNYHALSVLNYTHRKKIDIIYIDPPYNTGAKDWKYNNRFVDSNDTYRHSKWLSMMNNRLMLAKNLLKDTGVLVCTIDKYELPRITILLEEIFSSYEVVCVTIIHNPAGTQGKNFSHTNEYALFVYPEGSTSINKTTREDDLVSAFRDWGTISLREQAKTCFYPIIVKNEKIIGFGDVCEDDFHPPSSNVIQKDGSILVYPVSEDGTEKKWVFGRKSVESIQEELFCKTVKGKITIYRKKKEASYRTVWDDKRHYANIYGSKLLNSIIDTKFPFPKSLYAVEDTIRAIKHDKDDSIILDFFAGSGTTGHAVLELNKQDNGNRKFILCTNNESNIAEEVTYPRIKNIIQGYSDKAPIPANLRYFKTEFVNKSKVTDDTRRELVKRATEMICVKEDTFRKKYDNKQYKIYESVDHVTAILYDLDSINEFKAKLSVLGKKCSIYVFSLTNETFASDFADLKVRHKLVPIPESILEVYRKLFG